MLKNLIQFDILFVETICSQSHSPLHLAIPAFAYLAANIALNDKQTEYAKSIIQNRNMSPEYLKTSVWDFEMAYIKLHHLELPEATTYFNTFLRNFKGKFYVKDSYQKLSWCYYLQNNLKAAEGAKQLLLRRGSTDTDADKQAEREEN